MPNPTKIMTGFYSHTFGGFTLEPAFSPAIGMVSFWQQTSMVAIQGNRDTTTKGVGTQNGRHSNAPSGNGQRSAWASRVRKWTNEWKRRRGRDDGRLSKRGRIVGVSVHMLARENLESYAKFKTAGVKRAIN